MGRTIALALGSANHPLHGDNLDPSLRRPHDSMGLVLSFALVFLAGAFLIAFGATALVRPPLARRFLLGFASSSTKHYLELGIRLLVGAALISAAPSMVGTAVVSGAGWLLLVTTGVMFFIPWRVHRAFTQRAVPQALAYLPLMGLVSLAAGASVLWAMFSAGAA